MQEGGKIVAEAAGKSVSVTNLSMPLVMVVVAVVSIVGGTISGMGTYFGMKSQIDTLGFRLAALEGAKDEGTQLRLTAVEKKLEDIASNAQVTDWNRWRARVDGLILANAASATQNRTAIIGMEVDVEKLQDDLRDMMRNPVGMRPPARP